MKKIALLFLFPFFYSCMQQDEKKHTITEFKKPIYDTLYPKKDIGYTTQYIKLLGYVDDSIYVSFGQDKSWTKFYLTKKIDTLINPDYYGDTPVLFYFNPYRADKGKLEISFGILGSK